MSSRLPLEVERDRVGHVDAQDQEGVGQVGERKQGDPSPASEDPDEDHEPDHEHEEHHEQEARAAGMPHQGPAAFPRVP